jgi:putative FmdB family regulatory protein
VPIYEYVCPECGHPFEKRVSFAEADDAQSCPKCGHERAMKQISLVARRSAGSGGAEALSANACGPVG